MKDFKRYRLKPDEWSLIDKYRHYKKQNNDLNNVLIIGDLHEPFCLDGYLKFCLDTYHHYKCNNVVFIGDVIDNHFSSYHETDADGLGGGDELELAVSKIANWYKAFPKAKVIIGNHDRMIMRKAQTSSIPSKWIKSYQDVLEVPNWEFLERYVLDDVQYIHGEAGTARTKCRADMMNTVQGHLHTQCYTENYVGAKYRIFGMQVGCGIDHESYAMAYAKAGKKPAIACGVILNNGKTPINVMMEL
tara:strand:+ start:7090 stop:7827 length:738 start_codon:yes stop_codon:yes gene_type:complete